MATPPSGWIETGTTLSFTGSLTVSIAGVLTSFALEPIVVKNPVSAADDIYVGIESSGGAISCGSWGSRDSVSLYTRKEAEAFGARTTEQTKPGGCPQPYLSVTVTRSVVGARLIAVVDRNTGSGSTRYRTRLWLDEGTSDVLQVGSKSQVLDHTGGEIIVAPTIRVEHEAVPFLTSPPPQLANGIILSGVTWNGEVDPTLFDNYPMRGYFFGVGVGGVVWRFETNPPLHFTADVRVEDAAGATPAGLVRIGNDLESDLVTNPGVLPITRWRWTAIGGNVPTIGRLSGDWSAGGVQIAAGEEVVPLRQLKPKTPQNAPEFWTPATFAIASPVPILLSANTFSGTGAVVVSGPGGLVWDVSGVASVSRVLAESWRDWNDSGSGDYEGGDDNFTTTKHDYYASGAGDDVWGWGLFAWLDVDLTAPADGDVTLTVTWVAAGPSPVTATKTHVIPAVTGRHTYRVDLLFPEEGGPWYAERVDEVAFSGFQVGQYELHDLSLVAVEDAYVKLHARGNYSGLTISQDGSFAVGHWGDNPLIGAGPARQKDDESGLFDYGAGADTSSGGAVRMDGVLESVVNEWSRMEGITLTYDDSAIDADLTDGTNIIGTENELTAVSLTRFAKWYHTRMGLRAAANGAVGLAVSIYLDGGADLCPAPAGTFTLPFRHVLGMVLEAQCKDSVTGKRAGAEAPVYARRSLTGAPTPADVLLAAGETDASGFASVAVRTGTVGITAARFYTALLGS